MNIFIIIYVFNFIILLFYVHFQIIIDLLIEFIIVIFYFIFNVPVELIIVIRAFITGISVLFGVFLLSFCSGCLSLTCVISCRFLFRASLGISITCSIHVIYAFLYSDSTSQ